MTGIAATPRREWSALRILHLFPSLLVAGVTVAIIPLADPHASLALYVVLGLGMLCYQLAIGAANDLVDAADDALTKPWKPLPRGAISRRTAMVFAVGFAGAGMILTSGLDTLPWMVGILGLACGLAYDVHFKRTALAWLPWAVAFPLIPVWVYTATGAWTAMLWWVFPLGGLLALALYLANQAPGAEQERDIGVRGLAQSLGERRSAALAMALFGVASSTAVIVLLTDGAGKALLAAVAAAVSMLLAPRAQVMLGRDGLFGVLAAGAAVLSLVFLSAA